MNRVIAVAGGKGGTGKTFIAVNVAYLLSERGTVLLIDADVENPTTTIFMKTPPKRVIEIRSFKPVIVEERCTKCGLCIKCCPEHALVLLPSGNILFVEEMCSGCGICKLVCRSNAVVDGKRLDGFYKYYEPNTKLSLIAGELKPGNRRHNTLIAKLIEDHKDLFERYDFVVIDSPPGTAAGVYSTLEYADTIIAVVEPTPLGANDLRKFLTLVKMFGDKKLVVVLNKYGIPGGCYEEISNIVTASKATLFTIPYNKLIIETYIHGDIFVKRHPRSSITSKFRKLVSSLDYTT
ncbi:MAG: hypothetical protein DRJ51_03450 [Thermoprotei archaeon]|nr:MAG: hypothetical protein DRJ51_03450 [Thermoprotei archaeon]RLF02358.1 MAG: hypothetical protein DRJ59_03815 [Thermoprotei archaeon]